MTKMNLQHETTLYSTYGKDNYSSYLCLSFQSPLLYKDRIKKHQILLLFVYSQVFVCYLLLLCKVLIDRQPGVGVAVKAGDGKGYR